MTNEFCIFQKPQTVYDSMIRPSDQTHICVVEAHNTSDSYQLIILKVCL